MEQPDFLSVPKPGNSHLFPILFFQIDLDKSKCGGANYPDERVSDNNCFVSSTSCHGGEDGRRRSPQPLLKSIRETDQTDRIRFVSACLLQEQPEAVTPTTELEMDNMDTFLERLPPSGKMTKTESLIISSNRLVIRGEPVWVPIFTTFRLSPPGRNQS